MLTAEINGQTEGQGGGECRRCGLCCRRYTVSLNLSEARCIADGLGLAWYRFEAEYIEEHYSQETRYRLRRTEQGCVFLRREEDGMAACAIHGFKPSGCLEFSYSPDRRQCREGAELRANERRRAAAI